MTREAQLVFLAMCYSQPILKSDAVVVLCGEDAEARVATGVELIRAQIAPVLVLSGGVNTPPRCRSGAALVGEVLGLGLNPERVIVEHDSKNTREQAHNVLDIAVANQWTCLTLVASLYHLPRALLTFMRACDVRQLTMHFRGMPCASTLWSEAPPGMQAPRATLLAGEFAKIETYTDDCATYSRGVTYLQRTERP